MYIKDEYLEGLAARLEGSTAYALRCLMRFSVLEEELDSLPRDRKQHRKDSCEGKRRFDEAQARRRAEEESVGLSAWQPRLSHYPCLYCGGWHIGHSEPDRDWEWVEEPMTDASWLFKRILALLWKPQWLVEDPVVHQSALGSLLFAYFQAQGWEVPEKPDRPWKMFEVLRASSPELDEFEPFLKEERVASCRTA